MAIDLAMDVHCNLLCVMALLLWNLRRFLTDVSLWLELFRWCVIPRKLAPCGHSLFRNSPVPSRFDFLEDLGPMETVDKPAPTLTTVPDATAAPTAAAPDAPTPGRNKRKTPGSNGSK